jgi:glycerol-3-phosphate dehydrogenase subunit B
MKRSLPEISCELMIIGTGMAGMAAAIFAASQQIDVVQVGMTGELNLASGLLDLMAVHPIKKGKIWENPWKAIRALTKDCPKHPYALLNKEDMQTAFKEFISFFKKGGLHYHHEPDQNLFVITPVGTIKPTYAIPRSMLNGAKALQDRADCVIFDFHGLKGFSSRQIVETLKPLWSTLRAQRIRFPKTTGEIYSEPIALSLEIPQRRAELAELIKPHMKNEQYIGLPSVLGIYNTEDIFSDLQHRLGKSLFEIPTIPPSIAGLRIRNAYEKQITQQGVRAHFQHKVIHAAVTTSGEFLFKVGPQQPEMLIRSKNVILASGRFFGQGLHASRKKVSETIFHLPVFQPSERKGWHQKSFLDLKGHRINQFGLETDSMFRPLDTKGKTVFENLFAVGSILAHHDWMRMKCGSGLAITTAFAAVKSFHKLSNSNRSQIK